MKFYFSILIAKTSHYLFKVFHFGSGYTWPGHLITKIYPDFLSDPHLVLNKGVIVVSGTNGKTTTSKLLVHLLQSQNLKVFSNTTGANLLNGIISTYALNYSFTKGFIYDYAVLEVDEFSLPEVLDYLTPSIYLLLNLSRDQLDRYGEVDIIFDRWLEAFNKMDDPILILDLETSHFKSLAKTFPKSQFFSIQETYSDKTSLRGRFNVKNLNAAFKVLETLGYEPKILLDSLNDFSAAYGRGEIIDKFHIYLAKNPASYNNNLDLLRSFNPSNTGVLFVLNDNIPDGRDVSWIYDIKTALITDNLKEFSEIYVSGKRCYDMAVRLSYADLTIKPNNVNISIEKNITQLKNNMSFENVLIFPNYSAMLEIRKLLIGRSIL